MLMYHGSDKKLSVIEPLGVNMGMRFQAPRWSSYWWKDVDLAVRWAVFQTIRRAGRVKVRYHTVTGMAICDAKDVSKLYRSHGDLTAFVYVADIAFHTISIGSSPDIDEYTVDRPVRPQKTLSIPLNIEVLKSCVMTMTSDELDRYHSDLVAGKIPSNRNVLFQLLLESGKDAQRHKYMKQIRDGTLKPGDVLN